MSNSVFQERIKSNKFLLYLTTIAITLIDAFVAVILGFGGELFSIGLPIFVIAVLDLVLLLCVHFSNFRLKYSRIFPIIYMFITLATGVVFAPMLAKTVFTLVAFVLFVAFRAISILALIFSMANGTNRGKGLKVLSLLMTLVFVCASAFYVYNLLPNGFYGQGFIGVRNISYEYDQEKDGYVAYLIEDNKGDTIIIANEFNGKKVVGINADIFTCQDIKEIKLDCDAGFFVENAWALGDIKDDLVISVNKDKINDVRDYVYSCAEQNKSYTSLANAYVNLANQITPSGLSANQVYINFDYSLEDLEYADFETIDTWIGQKGKVFDFLDHAGAISYVGDYDLHNENFLKENYDRGGKVIDALLYDGVEIIGNPVNVCMPDTVITFTEIRKVFIQEDNDTVYNLYAEDDDFAKAGSARYVLETDRFDLLSDIKARTGFTVSFKYSKTSTGTKYTVTKLENVLTTNVYLWPEWKLNAPTITPIQKNQTEYTYGETLSLTATATHPAGDIFEYAWTKGTTPIASVNTYEKSNIKPIDDSGAYYLTVTAKPACTSLTSVATVNTTINVKKKVLNFAWDKTQDVFNGTNQTISANYIASDVINSDVIEGYIDGDSLVSNFSSTEKNAGNYDYSITLKGECDNLYVVDSSDKTHSWTITPFEVAVNWQVESYIYDRTTHIPTIATLNGIGDDATTPLSLLISNSLGNGVNAGNHTAKVVIDDSVQKNNYTITNSTQEYSIAPKSVTLVWENTSLVYDSTTQKPSATIDGICSGDTCSVSITGAQRNVGDYTASATLSNSNYAIEDGYEEQSFAITPASITLTWSTNSLVYSAQDQAPIVQTAVGKFYSDTIEFEYAGYGKVVGSYTATATIKNNDNYVISGSNTWDYSITAKVVTLTWRNTSLTYSGEAQKPSATVNSVCSGDTCVANITLNGEGISVGSYTATANLSNSNYSLSSNTRTFTINKKTLNVIAQPATITYGEAPINNGVTYSGFVDGEDESVLEGILSYSYTYSQYGNVGTYKITPSGYSAVNYNIAYQKGNLIVSARPLSVSIADKESIYGTTRQTLTASITLGSLVNGDSTPYSLSSVASSTANAGQYDIVGTTTNSNYNITFTNGTYTINKATLTVTAPAITQVTYGFTGSISYNMTWTTNNGRSASVTGSSSVKSNTDIGEYLYDVVYDSVNYDLVKVNPDNFKVKVNAKQVTLSWSVQSQYDLTNYTQLKPTVSGATLSSLNLTYTYQAVTGTINNDKPSADGKYIVTVSSQNNNYVLVGPLSTQFTITTNG